jgi:hypothetical protein
LWINLFDHELSNADHAAHNPFFILKFLLKLKVLSNKQFTQYEDHMYTVVRLWRFQNATRRLLNRQRQEKRGTFVPPKNIKPTKSRS